MNLYLQNVLLPLILTTVIRVQAQDKPSVSSPLWKWECEKSETDETERCIRVLSKSAKSDATTMATCQLFCGPYGSLVPKPRKVTLGREVAYFLPSKIVPASPTCRDPICEMLNKSLFIAKDTISKYHPRYHDATGRLWDPVRDPAIENHGVLVRFSVKGTTEHITMDTDESYKLTITTKGSQTTVIIEASTYFGARHGLETLTQLIDYDEARNSLQILVSVAIEDRPFFPYRGLLIDTARNFLPVSKLRHIIDAMSYNKLNTFHWHITETQSFPLQIKARPQMAAYGAYSPNQVYTADDVKELVNYARIRGIRIIPELDAPAHTGHGWQWGEEENLGKLVVCLDEQPWTSYCAGPPCGQLNLANPNIYKVLDDVYQELINMFDPVEFFHYGGDEVNLNCWNSSKEMYNWMMVQNYGVSDSSYHKQWSVFQKKVQKLVTKANRGKEILGILWTSSLTEHGRSDRYLDPAKYIIQVWTKGDDPIIAELLTKKFKIIMSNYDAFYLDCGVSSWVSSGGNWCSPYKGWQDIYDNDIEFMIRNLTQSNNYDDQLLGGEAAAWSEQIDQQTIDAKLWPRGAALAERLWSNPKTNFSYAEHRILLQRKRLVARGIQAARLQPEWCLQHQGQCKLPWSPPTAVDVNHCETTSSGTDISKGPLLLVVLATVRHMLSDS